MDGQIKQILPLLLVFSLAGCATYERATETTENVFTLGALDHEYRKAMKAYERENYALAATSFENLVDRLPESHRREEVLYRQGVAYLRLRDYHDADETFIEYLDRYPSGRYTSDVTQNLARVAVEREGHNRVAVELLEDAKRDLERLQALEGTHPADPEIKYLMGNIYYELGQYQEAGKKYFEAQALEAAYSERELIKQRMFINAQGEQQVLTPEDLAALERERTPLVIYDTYPYRSRNDDEPFSAAQVYAVMTGKIRNQGSQTLRDVTIEVRFLNAIDDILDVQYLRMGTMRPGEVRAFLAKANLYDDINNVMRVEFVARGDR